MTSLARPSSNIDSSGLTSSNTRIYKAPSHSHLYGCSSAISMNCDSILSGQTCAINCVRTSQERVLRKVRNIHRYLQ